jgi:hypothetical protein
MSTITDLATAVKIIDDLRETFWCINYTMDNWKSCMNISEFNTYLSNLSDPKEQSNREHAKSTARSIVDIVYDDVNDDNKDKFTKTVNSLAFDEEGKAQFIKDVESGDESKIKFYEAIVVENLLKLMNYKLDLELTVICEGTHYDPITSYEVKFKPGLTIREFFQACHKTFVRIDTEEYLCDVEVVEGKIKLSIGH